MLTPDEIYALQFYNEIFSLDCIDNPCGIRHKHNPTYTPLCTPTAHFLSWIPEKDAAFYLAAKQYTGVPVRFGELSRASFDGQMLLDLWCDPSVFGALGAFWEHAQALKREEASPC